MQHEPLDRDAALARVMQQRTVSRARPPALRALMTGMVAAVVAVPLVVLLPELGVPLLLVALRLLAVEFDRAARSYAWVIWRWGQVKARYARAAPPVRALVVLLLLALAAALVWLLVHEFL